ncbi:MAG: transketolase [Candidatus Magasanikbacteria bacterium CG10_big_fil_rev_8_21_14_0_10_47_10]|uniref:Transketolase n=1 Tax=Candidatus Magasanikbacteria bacterium CG10_big_fil_rev_8_21_14_0_10_47_10 TaxID=1974652 RepID=A0A2H0TQ88_9BACT|nr:MAG: transketolase [Candidatus Magasanikbacteria bacterium CG10_big_fil_rev_8_21_14_0_10_47_10]
MRIPKLSDNLTKADIAFLETFSKSCRHSILAMVTNAQSGHPGGSLGCIDYLSLLYTYIIGKTGDPVIVSNGHISPAVYAVLAEMGYIPKHEVIKGFRKIGFPYEGHVARHVPGVWYGTGPLGAGVGAASGFALAEKLLPGKTKNVYALIGDGESQEGQVYEMMNFAAKYTLNNFIVFMDYNLVQLSDGVNEIMPVHYKAHFQAAGWEVIDVAGHDYQDMWRGLRHAQKSKTKPVLLLGHTIMGKGVDFMEKTGKAHQADWHGKAPKADQAKAMLETLNPTAEEKKLITQYRKKITWQPKKPSFPKLGSKMSVKTGIPRLYEADQLTDCRSAYGMALLDLAKTNTNVVALTADLADSVKTSYVKEEIPKRHIECGIAEQQMVSCSGGLSLSGMIPFCSTFGAFMTSRAKDQARVNDINEANVKMVATHCGLSVGEDGPTHQAIDDMGSMLGLFNTMVIEPADPNHCDRIIRHIASHYGNFYVRMGRHKIPVLTDKNGAPFYDQDYVYEYGKCDLLRKGSSITLATSGAVANEALKVVDGMKKGTAELVIVSSPKKFDATLWTSIKKTGRVLVVEDHNTMSGMGAMIARELELTNICPNAFHMLGVEQYQLSGTAPDLYHAVGIDADGIEKAVKKMLAGK